MNNFIYPLRIHIEDTDFAGVVYHSNYLNFMERARSEWAEELGIGLGWQNEHQIYLPVCTANLSFLKPARLHEQVEVVSTIKTMKRASMYFEQYLRSQDNPDKIFCRADIQLACVDRNMKVRPWPTFPFGLTNLIGANL